MSKSETFTKRRQLGAGDFGKVFEVYWEQRHKNYVMKVLNCPATSITNRTCENWKFYAN